MNKISMKLSQWSGADSIQSQVLTSRVVFFFLLGADSKQAWMLTPKFSILIFLSLYFFVALIKKKKKIVASGWFVMCPLSLNAWSFVYFCLRDFVGCSFIYLNDSLPSHNCMAIQPQISFLLLPNQPPTSLNIMFISWIYPFLYCHLCISTLKFQICSTY